MILAARDPYLVLVARGVEGIGAGLFVASAMSWMNTRPDHEHVSGDFMASLNLGLVTGLLGAGWLAGSLADERGGILAFTLLSVLPAVIVFFARDTGPVTRLIRRDGPGFGPAIWMYLSAVVLVGATGAVTAIYPAFTGASPSFLGVSIATMNLATVITVFVASRLHLRPVQTIRASSILLAAAVLAILYTPAGFVLVGALLGFIMIAQLAFLAGSGLPQGAVMGSYNAASYLGMTILPFVSGVIADRVGFLPAFAFVACVVAAMAPVIALSRGG
jgi:MFS family permease